jgi:LysM repeat protein
MNAPLKRKKSRLPLILFGGGGVLAVAAAAGTFVLLSGNQSAGPQLRSVAAMNPTSSPTAGGFQGGGPIAGSPQGEQLAANGFMAPPPRNEPSVAALFAPQTTAELSADPGLAVPMPTREEIEAAAARGQPETSPPVELAAEPSPSEVVKVATAVPNVEPAGQSGGFKAPALPDDASNAALAAAVRHMGSELTLQREMLQEIRLRLGDVAEAVQRISGQDERVLRYAKASGGNNGHDGGLTKAALTTTAKVVSAKPESTTPAQPGLVIDGKVYTVRAGDTSRKIASAANIKVSDLVAWNGLCNRDLLEIGWTLHLSAPSSLPDACTLGREVTPRAAARVAKSDKQVAQGWRLAGIVRDAAVVRSPAGEVRTVRAGDELPGLGRVIRVDAGERLVETDGAYIRIFSG